VAAFRPPRFFSIRNRQFKKQNAYREMLGKNGAGEIRFAAPTRLVSNPRSAANASRVFSSLSQGKHLHRSRRVPFPFCQITLKAAKPLKDMYSKSFYRQQLKNIGAELSRKRLELKISQTELAKNVNKHAGTVANWEHSRSIPDICRLPRIIEFLGYDPLEAVEKAD
jgi:DNA-binding transcriptional regulator YiaG